MANFIEGCYLNRTVASGEDTVKGYAFRVGNRVGIAGNTAAEGEDVKIWLEGAFLDSPKTTGTAWTQGQALYWNASTHKLSVLPSAGFYVGTAYADATSGATTGGVLLEEAARQTRHGIATLASGTVDVADTRITATSVVVVTYATASTKGATLKAPTSAGVGFTITAIKEADSTTETTQVGTVGYIVYY